MLDPDNIQIQRLNLPDTIKIQDVPEIDMQCYNLEDDKEYEHYIKDIEREVRRSYEYRVFIRYLRENMNMSKCSFLKGVNNEESFDVKIEIHHYPFTLRDIVEIVYRKRSYYNEDLNIEMVAKEVMILHYKLLIGLIPLSETVHELAHNGRIFIPVDKVLGRYNLFVNYYHQFCSPEQLETLERIENYTERQGDILDTTILEQNNVSYQIQNDSFRLPEISYISDNMISQIRSIKENNYILPSISEKEQKQVICPIYFE